jgi:acylphosphatase
MKRLTAYVSGQIQKVSYRKRVIDIARALGLKGMIENLNDGRVKIIAEGDDEKLKWFESAIDINNTLIHVSSIEMAYSKVGSEFSQFGKFVEEGETDSRLDKGVEVMKEILVAIKGVNKSLDDMNTNLGGKIDTLGVKIDSIGGKIDILGGKVDSIGGKIDRIDGKMDRTLQKQDELLVEVKDMNASLNDKMDKVLDKTDVSDLKSDMAEVKTALKAKGII